MSRVFFLQKQEGFKSRTRDIDKKAVHFPCLEELTACMEEFTTF